MGENWCIFWFHEDFYVYFLVDSVEVKFFKLSMRVALLFECLRECLHHYQGTGCCIFTTYNLSLEHFCYFWLAWKMWVDILSVVVLAGQGIVQCGKNFNVAIFCDTINVINVKLCIHWAWLFRQFSVTLTLFQGHSSVKVLIENFMFLSD